MSVAVLSGLGLLAIWTVDLGQDPEQFFNFKKQLTFVLSGIVLSLGLTLVDFRAFRSLARLLYLVGFALLAGVLVIGVTIRGTQGWFGFGGFTFQPVEFAKVILIVVLARYLSKKAHVIDLKVVLNVAILAGLYVALTAMQPDFGSVLVLLAIAAAMLLFANVPRQYVLVGIMLLVILSILLWNFGLQDYQKARLVSFVDPESDPFGRGYNIRQSVIAVGSGGFFGRGLGEGSQSQLRFLPEAQTDFVFAVLAEQLGFFAVLLILGAYLVILWRLALIFKRTADGFALFCTAGFLIMVFVQTFLNIGMNIGLLPIVGLPLPFVSLGGSAMLANFLMLGVVQSIKVRG